MFLPTLPKKKADTIANGIFLILLGVLFFTETWWPGIVFAVGVNIAIRQLLTGRMSDFFITLGVLAVIIAFTFFEFTSYYVIPILFIAGGIYVIFHEYFFNDANKLKNQTKEDQDDGRKED